MEDKEKDLYFKKGVEEGKRQNVRYNQNKLKKYKLDNRDLIVTRAVKWILANRWVERTKTKYERVVNADELIDYLNTF